MDTVVGFNVFFISVQLVVSASVNHFETNAAPASVFEEINVPAHVNLLQTLGLPAHRREGTIQTEDSELRSKKIQNESIDMEKSRSDEELISPMNCYNEKCKLSLGASVESAFKSGVNFAPAPPALSTNIQKLFSHPEVKKLLQNPDSDKRYLVIYPNGTMERVKDVETLKQKYKNYVLINTQRNASATISQARANRDGTQVPPIQSISVHVKSDSPSSEEVQYQIPFAIINDETLKDKNNSHKLNEASYLNIQSIPSKKHYNYEALHPIDISTSYIFGNAEIQSNVSQSDDHDINLKSYETSKSKMLTTKQPNIEKNVYDEPQLYESDSFNIEKNDTKPTTSIVNDDLLYDKVNKSEIFPNKQEVTVDIINNYVNNSSKKGNKNENHQPINTENTSYDNRFPHDRYNKTDNENNDIYAVYLVKHVDSNRNNTLDGSDGAESQSATRDDIAGEHVGSLYKLADSSILALDGLFGEESGDEIETGPDSVLFFFVPSSEGDER